MRHNGSRSRRGVIAADPGFTKSLRKVTRDLGIPLIFDEVKTGFRVHLGGAAEFYGLEPDLSRLGKIIGGGLLVGALVGDESMMELLDPQATGGPKVFHSGTFNGNPLSLAAGKSTIEALMEGNKLRDITRRTEVLKKAYRKFVSSIQIPANIAGEGAMFNVYFSDRPIKNYRDVASSDLKFRSYLDMLMICNGVYFKPANRFCLSLAHSETDVSTTKEVLDKSLEEIGGSMPN